MRDADRKEFLRHIVALASGFRVETSEALLDGYWMGLEDLPVEQVTRAISTAMRTSRMMPTVFELRQLTGEMQSDTRAVHAWDALKRAIREHGAYRSVDFDDVVINATVRNLGGWQHLCGLDVEEFEKWKRKDFERIYKQLCASGVTEESARYLVGAHEINNSAKHFAVTPPATVATGLPPHRPGVVRELSAPERLVLEGRREESVADVAKVVALVAGKRSA